MMKKVAVIAAAFCVFTGCSSCDNSDRIYKVQSGYPLTIWCVDGREFLVNHRGGIYQIGSACGERN